MEILPLIKKLLWHPRYPLRYPYLYFRKRFLRNTYEEWLKGPYQSLTKKYFEFEDKPFPTKQVSLSLVTLVYNPSLSHFRKCALSVLNQSYKAFDWVIIDNGTTSPDVLSYLNELSNHTKIKMVRAPAPLGIAKGTAFAIEQTPSDWIAFLDHDDILAPSALEDLQKVTAYCPEVDFIYSDSDHCDDIGSRYCPILKPDTSKEYILGTNYVCHFHAIKRSLYQALELEESVLDGCQDWEMTLKAFYLGNKAYHIPKILYTQRVHPKQYSAHLFRESPSADKTKLGENQVACAGRYLELKKLAENYHVVKLPQPGLCYVKYRGADEPAVTLLLEKHTSTDSISKADEYATHKVVSGDSFEGMLLEIDSPFFVYIGEPMEFLSENWLHQSVGLFLREENVALQCGKLTDKHGNHVPTIITCTEAKGTFPQPSEAPEARPDPEVRREVFGFRKLWWIGRTSVFKQMRLETNNSPVTAYDCGAYLQKHGLRAIYDPLLRAQVGQSYR